MNDITKRWRFVDVGCPAAISSSPLFPTSFFIEFRVLIMVLQQTKSRRPSLLSDYCTCINSFHFSTYIFAKRVAFVSGSRRRLWIVSMFFLMVERGEWSQDSRT
ncbi:hypothetical protein AAHA92_33654 [Salvia divinorum]|uniref:Uncharacterized protein n=1 Tax=Salvia divinorum TaxID=28513 RepID=A0ABD1FPQ0_SALDI